MMVVYLTAAACANGADRGTAAAQASGASGEVDATRPLVVFLGDSLTAGYGLDATQSFPSLLAARLAKRGTPIRVVNAGVSGDTTTGGLERLSWLLGQKPVVLVVGFDDNDAFRGQPVAAIAENLRTIVVRAQAVGARVLILGMRVPPNYGPDYEKAFAAIYPAVAKETRARLVPFLLEGVAGRADLNQDDGIHPNVKGEQIVADNVFPYLVQTLEAK